MNYLFVRFYRKDVNDSIRQLEHNVVLITKWLNRLQKLGEMFVWGKMFVASISAISVISAREFNDNVTVKNVITISVSLARGVSYESVGGNFNRISDDRNSNNYTKYIM